MALPFLKIWNIPHSLILTNLEYLLTNIGDLAWLQALEPVLAVSPPGRHRAHQHLSKIIHFELLYSTIPSNPDGDSILLESNPSVQLVVLRLHIRL